MFNFFRHLMLSASGAAKYTFLARYREGHWFKRFELRAASPEQASEMFKRSSESKHWVRVSPVTKV